MDPPRDIVAIQTDGSMPSDRTADQACATVCRPVPVATFAVSSTKAT